MTSTPPTGTLRKAILAPSTGCGQRRPRRSSTSSLVPAVLLMAPPWAPPLAPPQVRGRPRQILFGRVVGREAMRRTLEVVACRHLRLVVRRVRGAFALARPG